MIRHVLFAIMVFNGISCLNTTRNDLIKEAPIDAKLLEYIIKCDAIHFSLPSMDTIVSNGIWLSTKSRHNSITTNYIFHEPENKNHKSSYGIMIYYFEFHTIKQSSDHFDQFEKSINDRTQSKNESGKNAINNNRYFFYRSIVVDGESNRFRKTCNDYIGIQNETINIEILGKTLSKDSHKINEYISLISKMCD